MAGELERLKTRPIDRSPNPNRIHRLKGPLRTITFLGKKLPQWQHEISASGRVWYGVDKDERRVIVSRVELKHPKETE